MLRRMMATLWILPDGTRCELIAIVPSGWNLLTSSGWQLEVIRGADRLRSDSFADVEQAYSTSKQWLSDTPALGVSAESSEGRLRVG